VGDGPLAEQLQNDAKTRQVSNAFIFTGVRQDMPDIYAVSDLL